jgi:hypothetical protein
MIRLTKVAGGASVVEVRQVVGQAAIRRLLQKQIAVVRAASVTEALAPLSEVDTF